LKAAEAINGKSFRAAQLDTNLAHFTIALAARGDPDRAVKELSRPPTKPPELSQTWNEIYPFTRRPVDKVPSSGAPTSSGVAQASGGASTNFVSSWAARNDLPFIASAAFNVIKPFLNDLLEA